MSDARRRQLLDWAREHKALIIEGDYDSEYRYESRTLDALRSSDEHDVVAYVGTFSKTLSPSLRLGFIVPPAALFDALVQARWLGSWHAQQLEQRVLARFIRGATMARYLRSMQRVYASRRRLLSDLIASDFADHLSLAPSAAGLHLAAWLTRAVEPAPLVTARSA